MPKLTDVEAVKRIIDELAGSDTCPLDWMWNRHTCLFNPCPANNEDTTSDIDVITKCWIAWAYGETNKEETNEPVQA